MSYTVISSPAHIMPVTRQMPTLKDPEGGGFFQVRRRFTLPLGRWEIVVPGKAEDLEPLAGLLEYVQGDTPFWFDGADFGEILEPRFFDVGDGSRVDFTLPHRHVFASSLIVYKNGESDSSWSPLGDGVICDSIRFSPAPESNAQLTAKYRRKVKVLLETESAPVHEVQFTDPDNARKSFYNLRYFLTEVPF